MQILSLSRRIYVLCGLCSPSEESSVWCTLYQIFIILFILTNLVLAELSNILLALYHLKMGNIVGVLFACLQGAGVLSAFLGFIWIASQRHNMRNFFNELQNIFVQCKFRKENGVPNFYIRFFDSRKHPVSEILFENEWMVWEHYEVGNDHPTMRLHNSVIYFLGRRIHFLLRSWWIRWDEKLVFAIADEVIDWTKIASRDSRHETRE